MATSEQTRIQVKTCIQAPLAEVWDQWSQPQHILQWNQASEDWFTRKAENDLQNGGRFSSRMEAKDGSFGFDFEGTYDEVREHERISYTLGDGRKVDIQFEQEGKFTRLTETFDAESTHSLEEQKQGWQAILDNFKKYVERKGRLRTQHFEICIDASPEKLHQTMLGKETYPKWTSSFHPGSRFEGSWEKGSEIRFLGPGEEGQAFGMVSKIQENLPGKLVVIEHLGILDKGVVRTSGKDVEAWAGAHESYFFREKEGKTLLTVVSDTTPEHEESMGSLWPKALARLKELCES